MNQTNFNLLKAQSNYLLIAGLSFLVLFNFTFVNAQSQTNCVGSTSIQKYISTMELGQKLYEGENLTSTNGKYQLRVSNDGELVIEEILQTTECSICDQSVVLTAGKTVWRAAAGGALNNVPDISYFSFNKDCNLCFVSKQNKGWCMTDGLDEKRTLLHQCQNMTLTDDGRLVLLAKNGRELWASTPRVSNPDNNTNMADNTASPGNVNNTNSGGNFNSGGTNNNNGNGASNPDEYDTRGNTTPNFYDALVQSSLRYNLDNVRHEPVQSDIPENQDRANIQQGARVCVNYNGNSYTAMVTGQGLYYGPNQDAYSIQIIEEPHWGQKLYLQPYQINQVGECQQTYIPTPDMDVPYNLNVSNLEQEIIREVNLVRANPQAYAKELSKLQFQTFGKSGNTNDMVMIGNDMMYICREGDQACKDSYMKKLKVAIDYLNAISTSLGSLREHPNLSKAAALLAADQGQINGPRHEDSQGRGPWCRAEIAQYPYGTRGECLNSGKTTAAGFVVSFLLSPGHRDILMRKDIDEIGVDVHQHTSGEDGYLRDVIMVGNSRYPAGGRACQ